MSTPATGETFHDLVSRPGWTLVDFWGPRCEPCLRLSPHVEGLADRKPGLGIVTVEAPKARRLCISLGIMGLPTFVLYRDGEEAGRLSESQLNESQLDTWLEEQFGERLSPAVG